MNKKPFTQNQYDRTQTKLGKLRLMLKEKKATKEEVIQLMTKSMHYGKGRANEIVSGWISNEYENTNPRRYNPNPVIKKKTNKGLVAVIKPSKDDKMIEIRAEHDLNTNAEAIK